MKRQNNADRCEWQSILCGIVLLCSLAASVFGQQSITQQSAQPTAKQSNHPSGGTKLPPNARITQREVLAVQIELRRLGLHDANLSGVLGPDTREALRQYQRKNGLPVTGIIDYATYESLGLPYPAPDPQDGNLIEQVGGTVKEGTRYGLEKAWDAGSFAASKSKDAAKASWEGLKFSGSAAQRKADSMIRRNDDDTAKDISDLFLDHREWSGVIFAVKDGMVTLKIPPNSPVNVGSLVYEIRKTAGVRSVFVIIL
ncbi:MAG: peptidoglycan-binding domain-containing protein [Blastocatellales bacterium]